MRQYLHHVVFVALLILLASCKTSPPSVDIEIRNDSTNDLNWVRVQWDDGEKTAGVLPPGISKVDLGANLPRAPKSYTAFMEFADENDGWDYKSGKPNSERKLYRIPIDVSPLKQLGSERYLVTFSVLSLAEAKLTIKKRSD